MRVLVKQRHFGHSGGSDARQPRNGTKKCGTKRLVFRVTGFSPRGYRSLRLRHGQSTSRLPGNSRQWPVGKCHIHRLRCADGLRVPPTGRKLLRQRISTGTPTKAAYRGDVWTWDFIRDATVRGGALKMLTSLDEHTRECHGLRPVRALRATDVLDHSRPHGKLGYVSPARFAAQNQRLASFVEAGQHHPTQRQANPPQAGPSRQPGNHGPRRAGFLPPGVDGCSQWHWAAVFIRSPAETSWMLVARLTESPRARILSSFCQ